MNYQDWRWSDLPFSSIEAWGWASYLLGSAETTEPVQGARVTDGFFRTLGVTPILGRDFCPGEDKPGSPLPPRRWSKPVTPGYLIGYSKTGGVEYSAEFRVAGSSASYCKQRTRWAIRNRQSLRAALAWRLQYSHA